MNRIVYVKIVYVLLVVLLVTSSCSVMRFVPEDAYLLDKVTIKSDSSSLKTGQFDGFIRQRPNTKIFNYFKLSMLPFAFSGTDSTKRINRFLWRMGEAPVIEDTLVTNRTCQNIQSAVQNLGYFDAKVDVQRRIKRRKSAITYSIHPGSRYTIGQLEVQSKDAGIDSIIRQNPLQLKVGMPFDVNSLDAERSRLTGIAHNLGYYRFNREHIRFEADTTIVPLQGWLLMHVDPYQSNLGDKLPHRQYRIGKIDYKVQGGSKLRSGLLERLNFLKSGELYRETNVTRTYGAYGRLDAVMGSNISFTENSQDSSLLDTHILVTTSKPHTLSAELEGTNSAGDLGAAVALSYHNRDLFHGSEVLTLKARGAFEAIKGLEGYDDQNYIEASMEASLKFPDFIFPFLSRAFRRQARGTSELSLLYDNQNRPEFHRRVFTAAWRYRWTGKQPSMRHRIDLLDFNYVLMPWISETFKRDYLDDPSSRNAILRYNYENLFIMKWGYIFTYSTLAANLNSNYGTNAYQLRIGVESAGNVLNGISSLSNADRNTDGHYQMFNVAFAQYAKFDFDFSKSFVINSRNSFAFHVGLGVAVPYGNSTILPYEKRYFSGGANSVRGWSVRGLGPGSFRGSDGRIDFINQTGDLKFDMNIEYRSHIFWKIDGAAFIDAGNIWTLRNYPEQPGGQFHFDTCWRQIAVAYGVGLRLNFNFFILRLDGGMKAVNPAYADVRNHYPILHPRFGRDFTFHFAVGLPF